jgi:CheY-like chemotaxis protein
MNESPRILLVEDDEKIQKIYKFAFESEKFEVITANNGGEALLRVKDAATNSDKPFAAILLDMMMMGMSGVDFLREFDSKSHPETKIVVLSNIDNPAIVEKAKELGAMEFLNKSDYDPAKVVEHIRQLISE